MMENEGRKPEIIEHAQRSKLTRMLGTVLCYFGRHDREPVGHKRGFGFAPAWRCRRCPASFPGFPYPPAPPMPPPRPRSETPQTDALLSRLLDLTEGGDHSIRAAMLLLIEHARAKEGEVEHWKRMCGKARDRVSRFEDLARRGAIPASVVDEVLGDPTKGVTIPERKA